MNTGIHIIKALDTTAVHTVGPCATPHERLAGTLHSCTCVCLVCVCVCKFKPILRNLTPAVCSSLDCWWLQSGFFFFFFLGPRWTHSLYTHINWTPLQLACAKKTGKKERKQTEKRPDLFRGLSIIVPPTSQRARTSGWSVPLRHFYFYFFLPSVWWIFLARENMTHDAKVFKNLRSKK